MSDELKVSEEDDIADGLSKKKFSGKKIIMAVVVLILVFGGGGAAFMLLGGENHAEASGDEQAEEEDAKPEEATELLFYHLDPMVVNLNSASGGGKFMKITISLEVDKQSSMVELEKKLPRIIDRFQTFLREMRLEDMNGSAGSLRLKDELLTRVNQAVYPIRVKEVLLQQMQVTG